MRSAQIISTWVAVHGLTATFGVVTKHYAVPAWTLVEHALRDPRAALIFGKQHILTGLFLIVVVATAVLAHAGTALSVRPLIYINRKLRRHRFSNWYAELNQVAPVGFAAQLRTVRSPFGSDDLERKSRLARRSQRL